MRRTGKSAVSVDTRGQLHAGLKGVAFKHWLMILMFGIPGLIILLKLMPYKSLSFMQAFFSLTALPASLSGHLKKITLLSIGAIIVVLFRITLGLRVLGPVRPILIALAYQIAGVAVATAFLTCVLISIAAIRPVLKSSGLPYFGRIATVLSVVALMIILALKLGMALGADALLKIGLLPVVVLTFAAEGFAKTLNREGLKSAAWRAFVTVVAAITIMYVANIRMLGELVLLFPEILLIQIGCIYIISRFLNFRALHWLNPPVKESIKKSNSVKKAREHNRPRILL